MKPAKRLYFVDFDRTVFRTSEHFKDFCEVVKEKFNIDVDELAKHERDMTQNPGVYSPLDDLRYSGHSDDLIDRINSTVREELVERKKDYLYDDVMEFFTTQRSRGNHVVLITVGTHEYQEHKRILVPALINLPMIITREPKGRVIKEKLGVYEDQVALNYHGALYEADKAILIDDRAGTFDKEMPKTDRLELYRMVRGDSPYDETTPEGVKEITSLTELDEPS